MGKRGNRAGTVYESPKGSGRWWAQLPAGPDGKRPRQLAPTKAAAEELLRQMHAEREAGRDLSRRAQTVKELMDAYRAAVAGQQRPGTRRTVAGRVRHITDAIGAMKITAVQLEAVQNLANKLIKQLSPEVTRAVLQLLHSAYETVIPERVARNPVDWRRLKLKKVKPSERRPLEDAQVRALLAAADNQETQGGNVRYAIAWYLGVLTGMRRGEIAGATWRDLDWKRAELKVRTQIAEGEEGFSLGQPLKTDDSVRVVPLGPHLVERLRQQWELLQAERKLRGPDWHEHGVIVCDERGEPIRCLNRLNGHLTRLARSIGIGHVHPHLLRHTFATIAGDEGFADGVIGAILGHSEGRNITRRYVHATERAKRAAMIAVETRILGAADEAEKRAK